MTGRGDYPDIGPYVCYGLIQTHIAMRREGGDMPYLRGMVAFRKTHIM